VLHKLASQKAQAERLHKIAALAKRAKKLDPHRKTPVYMGASGPVPPQGIEHPIPRYDSAEEKTIRAKIKAMEKKLPMYDKDPNEYPGLSKLTRWSIQGKKDLIKHLQLSYQDEMRRRMMNKYRPGRLDRKILSNLPLPF